MIYLATMPKEMNKMKIKMKIITPKKNKFCLFHLDRYCICYNSSFFVELGTYICNFIEYKGRKIDIANIRIIRRLKKCYIIPTKNKNPIGYYGTEKEFNSIYGKNQ